MGTASQTEVNLASTVFWHSRLIIWLPFNRNTSCAQNLIAVPKNLSTAPVVYECSLWDSLFVSPSGWSIWRLINQSMYHVMYQCVYVCINVCINVSNNQSIENQSGWTNLKTFEVTLVIHFWTVTGVPWILLFLHSHNQMLTTTNILRTYNAYDANNTWTNITQHKISRNCANRKVYMSPHIFQAI